jgi:hypothetical protein
VPAPSCLLAAPASEARNRPLIELPVDATDADLAPAIPFAFRVTVTDGPRAAMAAPHPVNGSHVLGVIWLDPAPPSLVRCSLSAGSTKIVDVETSAVPEHAPIVRASLAALLQHVHSNVPVQDASQALAELVGHFDRDLESVVTARHVAVMQETQRLVADTAGVNPVHQMKRLAQWRRELAAIAELVRTADHDHKFQHSLAAFAGELAEWFTTLQISALTRIILLQEAQLEAKEASDDKRMEAESRIQRLVSRLGLSAILPGIWLSFWGSNVVPPMPTRPAITLVAGGTIGLALIGDWIGRRITR